MCSALSSVTKCNIQFSSLSASGEKNVLLGTQIVPTTAASVWMWYGLICCGSICESHPVYSDISTKSVNAVQALYPADQAASARQKVCSVFKNPVGRQGNEEDDNRHPELENQLLLFKILCFNWSQNSYSPYHCSYLGLGLKNLTSFYFSRYLAQFTYLPV